MNKEESLKLFEQGPNAWNAWAEERLAERRKLEESGEWVEGSTQVIWNDATEAWHKTADADFFVHKFEAGVSFYGFVFPGRANFNNAAFKGNAVFDKADFKGYAEFNQAVFSDTAWFRDADFKSNAEFNDADFKGNAKFHEADFSGNAEFNEADFSGHAEFSEADFKGNAEFKGADFKGNAEFYKAVFLGDAKFNEADFSGRAEFREATFKGSAGFQKAVFSKTAHFMQTGFDSFISFNDCVFKGDTTYSATQVSKTFSLDRARFKQVPDFIQTHFAEVPRLDNFHIEPRRFRTGRLAGIRALFKSGAGPAVFWRAGLDSVKALFKGNANLAARWRALKKLAIMAYDHNSELRFFKEEILTKRSLFLTGFLYSLFSDFGRSVLRPLLLWALGVLGFAWCYLSQGGGRWADVLNWSLPCDAGTGNAVYAALGLSLRNALPLLGGGSAARLDQIYACLYGIHDNAAGELPARLRLVIPDAVAFAGVAQSLWSVVMIFLLLLALRNHFRIK